jgi:hypothetical protein
MVLNVFVSMGTCFTQAQRDFAEALDKYLKANGVNPVTPKQGLRREDTLPLIEEALDKCSGTIVIAFERLYADNAREFRSSVLPPDKHEQSREKVKITTVWNQIEATLAEIRQQPLLFLIEKGVRIDGFLEWNTWKQTNITLDAAQLSTPEFRSDFEAWKALVQEYERKKPLKYIRHHKY